MIRELREVEEIQKRIEHIVNYGGSLEEVEELMKKQIHLLDELIEECESDD